MDRQLCKRAWNLQTNTQFHLVKAIAEISKRDKEISKNLYKWLKGDDFKGLENFYENFKEKENVSQRRKDQTKMLTSMRR